jgi:hypothetical protein
MKQSSIEFSCNNVARGRVSLKLAGAAFLLACLLSNSEGGLESDSKNVATAQQTSANWYADYEWNVNLFGAYAFTTNTTDRYLGGDHAFGGGIDTKYFFARYFGVGVAGYALNAGRTRIDREGSYFLSLPPVFFGEASRTKSERTIGAALGTLTFRYPIPRTRFAPYAYLGGGGVFGGGEKDRIVFFRRSHRR